MSLSRNLMKGLCLAVAAVACMGCAAASDDTASVRETLTWDRHVAQAELAAAVNRCDFVHMESDLSEAGGFERRFVSQMQERVGKQVPDRPLTDGELRRLGVWRLPNGTVAFWQLTVCQVAWHYRSHGELPPDGAALFPELAESGAGQMLAELTEDEFLNRYKDGIDPITGQFYFSFSSEDWQPAAMKLEVIDDPAEIAESFPLLRLYADPFDADGGLRPPKEAWRVVVYGEEAGSVLYEGELFM